jgi:branched-subunit amino acid transport protein
MWIAVLGVGLGSLVLRVLPLLVVGHLRLTAEQEAFLGRAGLAAIAALIAVSARSAAVESSALAVVAAVGAGTMLAARHASMLRIVVIGGAVYAALRLAVTL